jgi:hypothetical protein
MGLTRNEFYTCRITRTVLERFTGASAKKGEAAPAGDAANVANAAKTAKAT